MHVHIFLDVVHNFCQTDIFKYVRSFLCDSEFNFMSDFYQDVQRIFIFRFSKRVVLKMEEPNGYSLVQYNIPHSVFIFFSSNPL